MPRRNAYATLFLSLFLLAWMVPAAVGGLGPEGAIRTPVLDLTPQETAAIEMVHPTLASDLWVTLKNGMEVLLRSMPDAPLVSSQIFIKTGSIYEGRNVGAGLTHFLEHVVSGGTTTQRSEKENNKILEELGGNTNAYTSYDRTVYYIDTTPDKFGTALDLLLSYALECTLDPAEVAREHKVIEREILMNQNNPDRELWQLFSETAYREHPIRHPIIGYLDQFRRVTREELQAYYQARYVPSNMILAVAGKLDLEAALKQVLAAAGDYPRTTAAPVYIPEEPAQVGPRRVEATSKLTQVTRLELGFPSISLTNPDLYALDVLSMILGSGRTSRLYQALKERESVVLSVSSSSWTPHFAPGIFAVSMTLAPDQVDRALDITWNEIDRIRKEGPTSEELERAKTKVETQYVYGLQAASAAAGDLAYSLYGTGDIYFNRSYTDRIQAVTAEQVKQAAQTYLDRHRFTLAVLNPESREKLEALKTSEVGASAPIRTFTLENGLKVLVQRDTSLPMAAVSLYGNGGTPYDPEGKAGLCSFMTDMLTRGAGGMDASEIARTVEDLGANLSTGSGRNTYYLRGQVLSRDLDSFLSLAAAVLLRPDFPQDEMEKLRRDTLLNMRRKNEYWIEEVDRIFRETQFKKNDSAQDVFGNEESVKSFTREDLVRFHDELVKPDHMVVAVFGDVDPEQVSLLIRKYFGGLHAGNLPAVAEHPEEFKIPDDRTVVKRNEKTAAGLLVAYPGLPLSDPRKPVLDVIDAMTSGMHYPGGWLQQALRGGDRSLVYVVHAFPSYYPDGGLFRVVAQCEPKDADRVRDIILRQMERTAAGEFTDKELNTAKDLAATTYRISLDTLTSRADTAALNEITGLGADYSEKYPDLLREVGRDAVKSLAKELFSTHFVVETLPKGPKDDQNPMR